jgi:starch phosphorylase
VPLFFQRGVDKMPRAWIARMKQCLHKLGPVFNTNRMVRDYAEKFYLPALTRGQKLFANGLERSASLAHLKEQLRHKWGGVRVVGVHTNGNANFKVGQNLQVEALVDLPNLKPEDIAVELYIGPLNATGQIERPQLLPMKYVHPMAPDRHLFLGEITCNISGRQGYAIRVVPGSSDLATPFEPGLIAWN